MCSMFLSLSSILTPAVDGSENAALEKLLASPFAVHRSPYGRIRTRVVSWTACHFHLQHGTVTKTNQNRTGVKNQLSQSIRSLSSLHLRLTAELTS